MHANGNGSWRISADEESNYKIILYLPNFCMKLIFSRVDMTMSTRSNGKYNVILQLLFSSTGILQLPFAYILNPGEGFFNLYS